jgi:hypothetical protein
VRGERRAEGRSVFGGVVAPSCGSTVLSEVYSDETNKGVEGASLIDRIVRGLLGVSFSWLLLEVIGLKCVGGGGELGGGDR